MNEWVKCSERMPDAYVTVLFEAFGLTRIGNHDPNHRYWREDYPKSGYFEEAAVRQWMPWPNPPEEAPAVSVEQVVILCIPGQLEALRRLLASLKEKQP